MNVQHTALPNNCCVNDKPSFRLGRKANQPFKRAFTALAKRRERRLDREALKSLLTMDDKTLKDIGINRGDVQWASKLPLSTSATTELEIIARRANRRV